MTHVDGQHDVDINVDITKAMGLAKELPVKLLLQVHFFFVAECAVSMAQHLKKYIVVAKSLILFPVLPLCASNFSHKIQKRNLEAHVFHLKQ